MPNGTLVLVRHAFAGAPDPKMWPDDLTRPLTPKGILKFKKAAAGLGNLAKPKRVLTSQAARCIQTASLLEWDSGWPAAVAYDVLDDGHTIQSVLDDVQALDEWPCTVALVGHGPNLSTLAAWLVVGYDSDKGMDKGGAIKITVPTSGKSHKIKPGTGKLDWQMTQKELKHHR